MRRLAAVASALAGLAAGPAADPAAAGPALVFDTASGAVVHAHQAAAPWYPASLTKLMTAYVTFEAIAAGRLGLDSPVTIVADPGAPSVGPTIAPGTTFSVGEILPLVLAASHNVAAESLAVAVSGDPAAFVAEMNGAARRLGMSGTTYVNPHGWHDPAHVTTARDLALLTAAIVRDFPQYQGFFAIPSVRLGEAVLKNRNGLLGRFPGADGMKTGYHCVSGYNLVATATRDGRRLGAVVLGAASEPAREQAAETLLAAAFAEGAGATGATVDSLPGPEAGARPVDMRPYVCGQTKWPPDLASFGIGALAPLPRPKP